MAHDESTTDPRIWRVEATRTVAKDRWIDLRADDCVRADGVRIAPYYVLHYPDWVHVLCVDGAGRICIVEQYRHGAGAIVRELPGGILDAGETPLAGAMRELAEETGLSETDWRPLGDYSPNPATHTNRVHVFACRTDGVFGAAAPDATEDIRAAFVTPETLDGYVRDGSFQQLTHIGMLYRWRLADR